MSFSKEDIIKYRLDRARETYSEAHAGLKSAFNRELILTGKIPAAEGRVFNQLFTFRQDADYKDFVQFEEAQIDLLFPQVKTLIDLLERLIASE